MSKAAEVETWAAFARKNTGKTALGGILRQGEFTRTGLTRALMDT